MTLAADIKSCKGALLLPAKIICQQLAVSSLLAEVLEVPLFRLRDNQHLVQDM